MMTMMCIFETFRRDFSQNVKWCNMSHVVMAWILAWNMIHVDCKPGGKPGKKDQCHSNPCSSAGPGTTCRNVSPQDYICVCPNGSEICEGYTCDNNPCKNGGHCSLKKKKTECRCPENWTGLTCEQATSPLVTPLVTNPQIKPDPELTEKVPTTKVNPPNSRSPMNRGSGVLWHGNSSWTISMVMVILAKSLASPSGRNDIQNVPTTSSTRSNGTADKADAKPDEEEWTLYGLSKVDLIGIGIPVILGIPGAILAFVKVCLSIRNKRAATDNSDKDKPTQSTQSPK